MSRYEAVFNGDLKPLEHLLSQNTAIIEPEFPKFSLLKCSHLSIHLPCKIDDAVNIVFAQVDHF